MNCFGIKLVLCDLYLTRFDLAKGLLFDTFFIAVLYKLCHCDYRVFEFQSFSLLPMNLNKTLKQNAPQTRF